MKENVTTLDKNIMRNEENITKVFEDIASVDADVKRNTGNITQVFGDVTSLTSCYQQQANQIQDLNQTISDILDKIADLEGVVIRK